MKFDRYDILLVVMAIVGSVSQYVLLRWWCGLAPGRVFVVSAIMAVFYAIVIVARMVGRRT